MFKHNISNIQRLMIMVMLVVGMTSGMMQVSGCGGHGGGGGSHAVAPMVTSVIGQVLLQTANANLSRVAFQSTDDCGAVPSGYVAVTGAIVTATAETVTATTHDTNGCFTLTLANTGLKIFTVSKSNGAGGTTVLKKAAVVQQGDVLRFTAANAFMIESTVAAIVVEDKMQKEIIIDQDDIDAIEGYIKANPANPIVKAFHDAIIASADPSDTSSSNIGNIDISPLSDSPELSGGAPVIFKVFVSGSPVLYAGGQVTISADVSTIGGTATIQSVSADLKAGGVDRITVPMTLQSGNTFTGTYTFSQNTESVALRYSVLITAADSNTQTETYSDSDLVVVHSDSQGGITATTSCGDGVVDVGEDCDRGSANTSASCSPAYGGACSYCDTFCVARTVASSEYCGDASTNGAEECDSGNSNTNTECVPGYGSSCTYCTNSCTSHTIQGGYCGDGKKSGVETCDNGSQNTDNSCTPGYDSSCRYCDNACTLHIIPATESCGDGTVQVSQGETCDNGASNTDTACTPEYGSSCTYCDNSCSSHTISSTEFCGDSTTQSAEGEQCDGGAANTAAACTPDYNSTCNYCDTSCQSYTRSGSSCGDGALNSAESCDNGSSNTAAACTPGYDSACTYCDTTCVSRRVRGEYCGDGTVQASQGEECDNGSSNTNTTCTAGYDSPCSYCDSSCKSHTVPATGYCGDGSLHAINGEQCDNGSANTDSSCTPGGAGRTTADLYVPDSCTYCDSACTTHTITDTASCGDGTVQSQYGEQCDNGASNGTACIPGYNSPCTYCGNSCQTRSLPATGTCGDSVVNGSEACDNGASNGTTCSPAYDSSCTFCDSSCQVQSLTSSETCGDGTVNGSEVCDNGGANTDSACTPSTGATCTYCDTACETHEVGSPEVCGDGILNGIEECDDGTSNGTACSPAYGQGCTYCSATCTNLTVTATEYCGDGATNGAEQCDDGTSNTDTACTPSTYGQGCTYCNTSCQTGNVPATEYCGDGTTNGTEQCDNGVSNTDTACTPTTYGQGCTYCSTSCTNQSVDAVEYCGDNTINGTEECDDGGFNTDTACTPTYGQACTYCTSTCTSQSVATTESCGDNTISGTESCDDGNTIDGDGCSSSCALETDCGNGTINSAEMCDDGNTSSHDGCSNSCILEPSFYYNSVANGYGHTCVINSDGMTFDTSVMCTGRNDNGQIGDNTTTDRTTPVAVTGLTGAVSVCTGQQHTCALLNNSTIKCWGNNVGGQLGDGSTSDRHTAVSVTGLGGAPVGLTCGYQYTCAVLDSGQVQCWGENRRGRLGDGTETDSSTPVFVSGIDNAVFVEAGGHAGDNNTAHTCAVLEDMTVKCWGENESGQLGDGTTTDSFSPVAVQGIDNATFVSAGAYNSNESFSCATLVTGSVKCWGRNNYGQFGNNTTSNSNTPVEATGLNDIVKVYAGLNTVCALRSNGAVKCWGFGGDGRLAQGSETNYKTPQDATGITDTVEDLDSQYKSSCVRLSSGAYMCWGQGGVGKMGDGATSNNLTPDYMIIQKCGDGLTIGTETCDDGNTDTESCFYGETSCTVCSSTCQNAAGATSFCGDSSIDSTNGETCDDGNALTEACNYGVTSSCSVCGSSCTETGGPLTYCGDNVIDTANGEQCDGGNTANGDGCDSSCQSEGVCGNGYIDTANGETCDDGNTVSDDGCDSTCHRDDPQLLVTIVGEAADDYFGHSVASAGDIDGDGKNEILIGAYYADPGGKAIAGSAYLYDDDGITIISRMDGEASIDKFGTSVASAGDIDGDGKDEILIGAPSADPGGKGDAGSVYIYDDDGTTLIVRLDGVVLGDNFGFSVASAGDVDGDGKDEILIGAFKADPGGKAYAGSAYLYDDDGITIISRMDGEASGDQFGSSVASAGDVDGDGKDEILIGAWYAEPGGNHQAGSVYLYDDDGTTLISHLDGEDSDARFGVSVASAGDVDGDGKAEILIGADSTSIGGSATAGSAYLYDDDGTTLIARIDGASSNSRFAHSVASAGDIDGDGKNEILIGAPFTQLGGMSRVGSVYIYDDDGTTLVAQMDGESTDDFFGYSIASIGDMDGDGIPELIISARNANSAGSAYIYKP